eukprot:SAG11_NODE_2689_length_3092_cov_16.079800_3_plen_65_part_00
MLGSRILPTCLLRHAKEAGGALALGGALAGAATQSRRSTPPILHRSRSQPEPTEVCVRRAESAG